MNLKALLLLALLGWVAPLQAAPTFFEPRGTQSPTPIPTPPLQEISEPAEYKVATPTPQAAPAVQLPTPTPTPLPGLHAKNPAEAAILSVVYPGGGQAYAGDPLKGLAFASVFAVGLWQTIDNFQLVNGASRNNDLGHVFALITLADYGFGIQDAYNTADNYNRKNHLTLNIGMSPQPNASLAYSF
jgi:hypothetical protein